MERGIQSIWFLNTAVYTERAWSALKQICRSDFQGNTDEISMLLRTDPNVSITPLAELSQLLHFRMRVLYVVLDGQSTRIVHADVATEPEEYSTSLICEET